LSYEKAAADYTSGVNGARREGEKNKAIAVAKNLKKRGLPIDQIAEDTGLPLDEIKRL
jgi:predicted transposase/invertase (TIGR01784 family)